MILFPAIDLKGGACVRLVQGDMNRATVFSDDPTAQAREFEDLGFEYLHIVDLDGAFAARSINQDAIVAIRENVSIPIQLGGGIRSIQSIENWLSLGINRVILGTVAVRNPSLVREAANIYPGQIAIGIDSRDGFVAVEGWAESSNITAVDLAMRLEDAGVAAIIYTDIERDGALQGLNIKATLNLAESVNIPVIASGGLASMSDIERLLQPDCAKLAGAISGRAIYDGRLNPRKALELINQKVS